MRGWHLHKWLGQVLRTPRSFQPSGPSPFCPIVSLRTSESGGGIQELKEGGQRWRLCQPSELVQVHPPVLTRDGIIDTREDRASWEEQAACFLPRAPLLHFCPISCPCQHLCNVSSQRPRPAPAPLPELGPSRSTDQGFVSKGHGCGKAIRRAPDTQ